MSINNKEKNFVFQVKTKRFYQTITSFKLVKKYSRDNITNLIISNQYLIYISISRASHFFSTTLARMTE